MNKDYVLSAAAVGFGAWMFNTATHFKAKAAFWPKIVAGAIILMGIVIALTALYEARVGKGAAAGKAKKAPPSYTRVLAIIALMLAYFFAFQKTGYIIPTFAMICGISVILGYRNWKVMVPTALIISVGLYFAFTRLFGVHFMGLY
ncbi:MAG: tripartite tricarboxylate transporter TctB family protein [Pyramidobacter sp.]|nr:tripartite tricarboxylate transporter TctB family protein [Pyramidobacter sp.]